MLSGRQWNSPNRRDILCLLGDFVEEKAPLIFHFLRYRTSRKKNDKKFVVAFTPNKAEHCVSRLKVGRPTCAYLVPYSSIKDLVPLSARPLHYMYMYMRCGAIYRSMGLSMAARCPCSFS